MFWPWMYWILNIASSSDWLVTPRRCPFPNHIACFLKKKEAFYQRALFASAHTFCREAEAAVFSLLAPCRYLLMQRWRLINYAWHLPLATTNGEDDGGKMVVFISLMLFNIKLASGLAGCEQKQGEGVIKPWCVVGPGQMSANVFWFFDI